MNEFRRNLALTTLTLCYSGALISFILLLLFLFDGEKYLEPLVVFTIITAISGLIFGCVM